ncbi:MAG: phage tail protein [Candidatus Spyradenecus sp.]
MSGGLIKGIEATQADLEKARKYLAGIPDGAERAILNAFNRAILSARTSGTKEVRKVYAVRADKVRKSFAMHRASRSELSAELVSRGDSLPLSNFRYRPTTDTTGNRRKQVRVQVRNDGGLKPLGQAFIWGGKVMQRLGEDRLPVQHVHALAVPVMLSEHTVVEAVQMTMLTTTQKRLDHEIHRLLAGYEGKAVWRD